jgi:hypothetical protein
MLLRRNRYTSPPDPLRTLTVQWRLTRIAWEIRQLERDEQRWAKAHHLRAAEIAYDDLLAEACRLSSLPLPDGTRAVRRLIMESDLRAQGWTW